MKVAAPDARPPLKVLDLFSGFGAYSLGLERTGGFETVAFCETRPYCRKILKRHWPHVPIWEDVENLNGSDLQSRGLVPDWIVAGWPCQGNSPAGTGLGMDDPRSGLWRHIRRLADELRPLGLLLENSSNLLAINDGRDFGRVLGDLAALGYDAEWHCLPAAAFDAPHIRDRVWIVAALADADDRQRDDARQGICAGRNAADTGSGSNSDANPDRQRAQISPSGRQSAIERADGNPAQGAPPVAPYPQSERRHPRRPEPARLPRGPVFDGDYSLTNAHRLAPIGVAIARQERVSWQSVADFRGMVHGDAEGLVEGDMSWAISVGEPDRVERIHGLGNLNPPIIPEMLGRAILEHFAPPPERAGRAGR